MFASTATTFEEGNVACPLCQGPQCRRIWQREAKGRHWQLRHCSSCGLHFTYPYPTIDDIHTFYSQDYHHDLLVAGASERLFGEKFDRYVRAIRTHYTSGRSLDIGCSTGLLPKRLKDAGFDAEGLEANPETAEWGRRHFGVAIHTGTLEELAETGAEFDVISMTDVLEHTVDPIQALGRVNRMLRLGGGAFITFPDILSLKSRYYYGISKLLRRDWLWGTCYIPEHTWEFSKKTAANCFERMGFKVIGFHRAELFDGDVSGLLSLLQLPLLPLRIGAVANLLGSQMEFVLEKVSTV